MFRTLLVASLLTLGGCADASIVINNIDNSSGYRGGQGSGQIYICMLTPFSSLYADAARSEQIARYKVGQRCERGQGEGSLFCRPKDASCSTTTLDEGYSQGADRLMVYEDSSQRGASLSIDRDIPDLSRYRFADRISSFSVPQGWTVRFYEGTDYSGGYYTRSGGEQEATGFNDHIRSIRILNR
ncbi:hypothetical protein DBV23_18075 [Edwardsiella ictaluri]|uniref:MelB GPH transporter, putative n=1 Tax=Edwardsiella ictaluri (strain 93-146) TaxID=634503 RepID=C5BFJ5_EDWI9|nr:beta/gamma crystallin-related protein [Edwardsiella ictaluri]ACR68958.1 MelB GPH transporter, putative [Edwardsiella ictaluri 93-146]AVZ83920.1 hypothetical protein DBV23_18075 [Edwardsiella ictaluri]EKS7763576.1 hypothetical protein [Edwardsiella ictaluri]EKS7769554.1 hypothetical protein [Edwardsiella ictaluri]EKS7774775.1 hypothetical protein [Edwardsiella ictaluri]